MMTETATNASPNAKTASHNALMRAVLERIAAETPYRSGFCQTDISYAPALTAEEAQKIANEALWQMDIGDVD